MRKNIKKIIIIMFFIIMFLYNIKSYANTEEAMFKVSNAAGKNEESITLNISLEEECNFVSANLVLEYNTEKMEYIDYKKGEILENAAMHIVKENGEKGKIAIAYVANPTNEEKMPVGDFVKLTFKVKSDVSGKIENTLTCTDLKNEDGEDVTYSIAQANINVIGNQIEVSPDYDKEEDNVIEQNKDSMNGDITNNTSSEDVIDNTKSEKNIPKAGYKDTLIYIVIMVSAIIFFYKKYYNLKDI